MTDYTNPPTNIAGYNPVATARDCWWDAKTAARVVDFFHEVLTHPDDSPSARAGDPFTLQKWQADYLATLYGWRRPNRSRRFTESLLFVPRKNGKTAVAAGIQLYALAAEGKQAAQIYSAAVDRDQASAIYRTAARMVYQSKHLTQLLKPVDSTKRITFPRSASFYAALSGDASTGHSKKPYVVLFDELHTQRTRDLYDALRTGQGATIDPLFISITTAGHNRHSICYEVYTRAKQIRDGVIDDPYFLPCIYEIAEGEPWDDEATWAKCNPNLGVSVSLQFLRDECRKAKDLPAYENTFRNLYLNQWTEQAVRWLPMEKWDACGEELRPLDGRPCWAGLDLSSTTDLTTLVLVFPDDETYDVLPFFWVPEGTLRVKARKDNVPYDLWKRQGFLRTTPGDRIDYSFILRDLVEICVEHNVQQIRYDRWGAEKLRQDLDAHGIDVVEFGQGFASMSNPSKLLEKLVIDQRLRHGGHPVLRWNAANAVIEIDAAENIKPTKDPKKVTGRVDGIVGLVMGLDGASTGAGAAEYWSPSTGVSL